MGCDIHAHLEVKISGDWYYYAPVAIRRNYPLFTKMAGVRAGYSAGITPISQPRGLPDDVSFLAQFHSDDWGVDGHSHSWLNHSEIVELCKFIKDNDIKTTQDGNWGGWSAFDVWLFGNSIESLKEYPEDYPKELEDVRLVFWFDN